MWETVNHGIGEVDCEFKNYWDVVNYYTKKFNKMPIQISDKMFMFEDSDYYHYLNLEDVFTFYIGTIVSSNNNFCPIRFYKAEIISRWLNNYYPMYEVKFPDGTTRICREKELILLYL